MLKLHETSYIQNLEKITWEQNTTSVNTFLKKNIYIYNNNNKTKYTHLLLYKKIYILIQFSKMKPT